MKDLRRLHFKKDTREFCFDALADVCPVTSREFHIRRIYVGAHILIHRTPANCVCSECKILLYKERKERVKRGMPVFFGKIV